MEIGKWVCKRHLTITFRNLVFCTKNSAETQIKKEKKEDASLMKLLLEKRHVLMKRLIKPLLSPLLLPACHTLKTKSVILLARNSSCY